MVHWVFVLEKQQQMRCTKPIRSIFMSITSIVKVIHALQFVYSTTFYNNHERRRVQHLCIAQHSIHSNHKRMIMWPFFFLFFFLFFYLQTVFNYFTTRVESNNLKETPYCLCRINKQKEVINARKTSHKHSNKDLSRLR